SLPRAVLHNFGVEDNLAIFISSEIPPGTGLGSSSSVTVALCKAISAASGRPLSKEELARLACEIEIGKLGKPIGVQDQYASAYGGLNWMTFGPDGVTVEPVRLATQTLMRLESKLLLMFTGESHDSSEILARQRSSSAEQDPGVIEALKATQVLAKTGLACLQTGDLDRFGALLDEAWQHKRQFAPGVTNARIDHCYAVARNNGALGGKIAGAGGGGFLLLYCEDSTAPRVEAALHAEGLRRMDFRFEQDGARVLFNAGLRLNRADR
ncbi:MAG: GHMP kinase, partial [Thermoflexales bacterium]